MTTYFISGHLDLAQEEFDLYYKPQILNLLYRKLFQGEDINFVVGDAMGADLLAQKCLEDCADVTVYHMFEAPRNCLHAKTMGGFKSDKERDEAMTMSSNEDIAWVRPGREKSGTAKNLKRRTKIGNGVLDPIR